MIGLEFLRHGNRFATWVHRQYFFSAERSDSRKYVCVRRLYFISASQIFKPNLLTTNYVISKYPVVMKHDIGGGGVA